MIRKNFVLLLIITLIQFITKCIILLGEKSLRQILEDAKRIAECCTNPDDRDKILKAVSNLESMAGALQELRQQGKVQFMSSFVVMVCLMRHLP